MTKYVVYYESNMNGEEEIFSSREKALKEAENIWNHLTKSEKEKVDQFNVFSIEATGEDLEDIEEGNANSFDFWSEEIKTYVRNGNIQ